MENYIRENHVAPDLYEFQALYGVPIENTLHRLLQEGHHVRIYVPWGSHWHAYSIRRLQENPDIAGYVFRDFFKRFFISTRRGNS
jgi:proline dehydrogenase